MRIYRGVFFLTVQMPEIVMSQNCVFVQLFLNQSKLAGKM